MFGDLEALKLALLEREEERALGPLFEILGAPPAEGIEPEEFLESAVLAFLREVQQSPRTWRLVLMPPRGSSPELQMRIQLGRRTLAERIVPLLEWGFARRAAPPGFDHELAARLIVAAGEDAARLMLAHPKRFAPERFAAVVRDSVALLPAAWHPRGNPPPRPIEVKPPSLAEAPAEIAPGRVPRADRRRQLLDVALTLIDEEGFGALSMEAIARRLGVNRAIVYRSFSNIGVLLAALLRREDRRTRRLLEALVPPDPRGQDPARVLGEALSRFLEAVLSDPRTWRLALLRPEGAPIALQKLVNRRRSQLAHRIEPVVRWALANAPGDPAATDVGVLARMVLSVGEEQGRLALEDPDFPPERLLASSWALLDALPLGVH